MFPHPGITELRPFDRQDSSLRPSRLAARRSPDAHAVFTTAKLKIQLPVIQSRPGNIRDRLLRCSTTELRAPSVGPDGIRTRDLRRCKRSIGFLHHRPTLDDGEQAKPRALPSLGGGALCMDKPCQPFTDPKNAASSPPSNVREPGNWRNLNSGTTLSSLAAPALPLSYSLAADGSRTRDTVVMSDVSDFFTTGPAVGCRGTGETETTS